MNVYEQSAKIIVETALTEYNRLAENPEYGGSAEDVLIAHLAEILQAFGLSFEGTI